MLAVRLGGEAAFPGRTGRPVGGDPVSETGYGSHMFALHGCLRDGVAKSVAVRVRRNADPRRTAQRVGATGRLHIALQISTPLRVQ